jgi:ABC-type phosphate/phosphonate transport system substrate-binding protein
MSRLRLMVCPHDTAKDPEKWYYFAQYIALKLNAEVGFDIASDFKDFHEKLPTADIVYANPRDTVKIIETLDFQTLARPEDIYDEVVFIASNDIEEPKLPDLQGERIATVMSMLPTNIALHLLEKESIEPGELVDNDTWISVMNAVRRNDVRFGFVYKDTYDALSGLSRSLFNMFHASKERLAFHSINVSPNAAVLKDTLADLLVGMNEEAQGKDVLRGLAFSRWVRVTEMELDTVKGVVQAYV